MSQNIGSTDKPVSVNLKTLLARLKEINAILGVPEEQLDFLATATPLDEKKEQDDVESQNATLDSLSFQIDMVARKANHIAKNTNTIVGN